MASNSFGKMFRITTFGESHGPAIGVVIDGCPAGLKITEEEINYLLSLRQPGKNEFVSPRIEADRAKILSGVFEQQTTGAPITILIENQNQDSSKYELTKYLLKPGHANYTYSQKYGIFDYRGSGRASARETACRVAASAVAVKILERYNITTVAYLKSVGNINASIDISEDIKTLKKKTLSNAVYCPNEKIAAQMMAVIAKAKADGDSIGGVVEFVIAGLPIGLGDPVYEKFSAKFASAMFSIPAVKGFEIGEGFRAAKLRGSENNDLFAMRDTQVSLMSNHSGGILAGITTGMPVIGRVAFKPTPTIAQPQQTIDFAGHDEVLQLPVGSKHDTCVAIRGAIVVEAMCILIVADALLINKCAKFD
jgi:chorismate synthase